MTMELKELWLDVGERRIGRLMKINGIRPVRARRDEVITDSHHHFGVAANLTASIIRTGASHILAASAHSRSKPWQRKEIRDRHETVTCPWRCFEAVEFATLEWVDWFNNERLLELIGNIPAAEAEERYYAMLGKPVMAA
jgi:transposase InsO family protein